MPDYQYGRAWNSKTFLRGGGIEREFHVKWIHWLDAQGNWQDIDPNFIDEGSFFAVRKAPFQVEIPKLSTGTARFVSDNRWDVFEKKRIDDAPFTQTIKALGVSEVEGV